MNLPKLEIKCPECKGEKYFYSQAWADHWTKAEDRRDELTEQGIEYYKAVLQAEKELRDEKPEEPQELVCGECEGKGTILTAEGIEIMRIVRKYW